MADRDAPRPYVLSVARAGPARTAALCDPRRGGERYGLPSLPSRDGRWELDVGADRPARLARR